MTRIVGISGSLRTGSFNRALLNAACQKFPGILHAAAIDGIPLYNADLEETDFPTSVIGLQRQIVQADGVLLVSPEYNNSVPGVFKNAVDWLSRPSADYRDVFRGKPVGLIGTSPGGFGTILSQNAWLPVLRALGASYWTGGRLLVSHARVVFDEHGHMVDEDVRGRLDKFIEGFIAFCERAD